MTDPIIPKVFVEGDTVRAQPAGGTPPVHGQLQCLPEKYVAWINEGRRAMYDSILEQQTNIRFFSQHLPVVVTCSMDRLFPFNCANKGVGFVPRQQYLTEFIDLLEATHRNTRNRPWRESLRERVQTMSRIYFDSDKMDYRAMASLEIFERQTFNNLCRTPMASLLYTGDCPDYTSFQLDCVVEIVGPDDPRHRFTVLARTLFEFESFHIMQTRFPYAYIFWIAGVTDKTPVRRPDPSAEKRSLETSGTMRWHEDAMQAVSRAPSMIQQFIRESVEDYASRRGFTEISAELLEEARANLT